ncbi:hypothetical protein HDZ31DRAFT_20795, partial [Schizophyllum fasciatum]
MSPGSLQGRLACIREHPPDEVCEECAARGSDGPQQTDKQAPAEQQLSAMLVVAKGISALARFLRKTGVYGKLGA